jgi:hypothetical protein
MLMQKERQIGILKLMNEELSFRKAYNTNFDKLAEVKKVKWQSPNVSHEESEQEERCLSTQNHYACNKQEFYDYERFDEGYSPEGGPLDYLRPYHSMISEADYPDP